MITNKGNKHALEQRSITHENKAGRKKSITDF